MCAGKSPRADRGRGRQDGRGQRRGLAQGRRQPRVRVSAGFSRCVVLRRS
jgi:hypothetical protein